MDTKDFWTLDQFKQNTLRHTKDFRTLDQFIQKTLEHTKEILRSQPQTEKSTKVTVKRNMNNYAVRLE